MIQFERKIVFSYGIDVAQKNALNNRIVNLSRWFYRAFGCEKTGRKNKDNAQIIVVKNWNGRLQSEHIQLHLRINTSRNSQTIPLYKRRNQIISLASIFTFWIHFIRTLALKIIALSRNYQRQLLKKKVNGILEDSHTDFKQHDKYLYWNEHGDYKVEEQKMF